MDKIPRSESIEKKRAASSSPSQGKPSALLNQEGIKGLQASLQELLIPLNLDMINLTGQMKAINEKMERNHQQLNDKIETIKQQLQESQKQILDIVEF